MYGSLVSSVVSFVALAVLLLGCQAKAQEDARASSALTEYNDPYPVQVEQVQTGDFEIALNFRGKLEASRSTIMRFPAAGIIEALNVRNGAYVRKGEVLARLNDEQEQINLKKAENNLRQAKLSREYSRLGYAPSGEKISDQAMEALNLQSGYDEALLAIEEARLNLKNRVLIAPFDGKVVDLKARAFENSADHPFFCRIIEPHTLIAKFSIVEEEIRAILASEKVSIFSHIAPEVRYETSSFHVNPVVNENGFSEVMATFDVDANQLWEGMSVHISAIETLTNTLFVPKSAVVKRNDGQDVVFTYQQGIARWQYVDLGKQNEHFWSVKDGLASTDTVIVAGNLNLADGVPVTMEEGLP